MTTRRGDAPLVKYLWRAGERPVARAMQQTPLYDFGEMPFTRWWQDNLPQQTQFWDLRLPHDPILTCRRLVDGPEFRGLGAPPVMTVNVEDGELQNVKPADAFTLWCYFTTVEKMGDGDIDLMEKRTGITPRGPSDIFVNAWWMHSGKDLGVNGDIVEHFCIGYLPTEDVDNDQEIMGAVVNANKAYLRDQSRMNQIVRDRMVYLFREAGHLGALTERAYPVLSEPATKPMTKREKKTAEFKPWLRTDLTHIIFIEPGRETEHGARAPVSDATPEPTTEPRVITAHRRRGHWRTLNTRRRKGERVWVKPTWVGPKEWAHDGVEYRVLEAA